MYIHTGARTRPLFRCETHIPLQFIKTCFQYPLIVYTTQENSALSVHAD